jgi:hypothetical protein
MVRAEREADCVGGKVATTKSRAVVHIIVTTIECISSGVEDGEVVGTEGVLRYGWLSGGV